MGNKRSNTSLHTDQIEVNLRKPKADKTGGFFAILDECLFNFTRFLQTPVFLPPTLSMQDLACCAS